MLKCGVWERGCSKTVEELKIKCKGKKKEIGLYEVNKTQKN
jgi:ribosomal protein L31E